MHSGVKMNSPYSVRGGPLPAIDSAISMAKMVIDHSREYRTPSARGELIGDVISALRQFLRMTDTDPGATTGSGYADGFLRALNSQDDRLQSVIGTHGLYFAAMAAVSQATQDDTISSVLMLICVAHTWNHTKRSERQRWIASQPRSPFVALTKQLIKDSKTGSVRELWNRLAAPCHQVLLGNLFYTIDVEEEDGCLSWAAECNEFSHSLDGTISWERFPSFVSKCRSS